MVRSVVVALAVALTAAPSTVQGYAKYVKLVPNGGNVPDNSNIGHLDPAGETGLSDFGKAFSTAGNAWTAALCQADTDGDGFTNGQELGDPCCTWTTSSTAGLVADGVSDPSDATKTPTSSELKAGCSSSGTSTSANFTGSGDSVGDVVGTVSPAGPTTGGMPPDDDEDDSSESAVLTAGASMTTISSVAMGVATAVVLAVVL
ncbi:hypothetical protein JG688_00011693 [Phytophthora aleatoria]|uniref:Temptin Cys/Cys disulfide domain-containing protein n=1 Tax=Phytophthora aleatoria TaxID=2496075 RepID=A0A8J5INV3_9STRA|nr:hypothetical protein JG688_00011693 [Phytophthora aleatoria]